MSLKNSSLSLIGGARGTPGNQSSSIDRPHEMNRYMGGHRRVNHPYISGYWYLIIEPPMRLFNDHFMGQQNTDVISSANQAHAFSNGAYESARWIHSTAEGFTPPSRTLTKVDVPGLGGTGSSFVAGQQLTRTFTITFREYQDTPVLNTFNLWTSVIDHHYGVSPLMGNEYIPANYKGAAWVFLCKPTLTSADPAAAQGFASEDFQINYSDVDQFFFFEGVFPEAAPFDGFNSDIATNDVTQLSVTFSFDGWPKGKENDHAYQEGLKRLNTIHHYDFMPMEEQHIGENARNIRDHMSPGNTQSLPTSGTAAMGTPMGTTSSGPGST